MNGDLIDLEPALRDAVVLALPLQPLCRDDCPGLCPECGARLADDPGHAHDAVDPRWAALRPGSRAGARPQHLTDQHDRHAPPTGPRARTERGERHPWPFRSGRCRAATPARGGRNWKARPDRAGVLRPRAASRSCAHTACPTCGTYNGRDVLDV